MTLAKSRGLCSAACSVGAILWLSAAAWGQTATGQSPMLDAQVSSGALPPVAERVGDEPLVMTPLDGVRNYGGNLRMFYSGAGDESWLRSFYGYENLVSWDSASGGVVPDAAKSWDVAEDGKSITFHLRKGMKWSDGEPFTAEDIAYWINHVQNQTDIDPESKSDFIKPDDGASAEVIDPETVVIRFEKPKAMFLTLLTQYEGVASVMSPKHYLEQYNIDTNPKADDEAKAAGFANWADRYNQMSSVFLNPKLPTILPWLYDGRADDQRQFTLTRNPYYWKIDDQGNQLPYIDTSTNEVVQNTEVMLLKALNGEIDFIGRYINTDENRPVFFDNEQRAGLKFFEVPENNATGVQIHLNLTDKNPDLRKFFDTRDVRVAMSVAIDRQQIIDQIYGGQGEPNQVSVRPEETAYYDEELAKQYTEFDPDKANELLDKAGYDKRDANGWRMTPDGKPLYMIATVRADRQNYVDMLPFIVDDWRKVGLNVDWRSVDKAAKNALRDANGTDILLDDGDGAGVYTYIFPRAYVPLHSDAGWAPAWVHYVTGVGSDPEQPPENIQKVIDLYKQMQAEPDLKKQSDLYRQLLAQAKANFNQIGISTPPNRFGAVTVRMHNVPEVTPPGSGPLSFAAFTQPEQFSIQQ